MVRLLIIFLIFFAFPVFAQDKVFNAKSYELDNGLKIIVIENRRAPVVTHMIWYRVGAADEPRGASGLAHFFEHLMFKGHAHPELGTYAPGEFSRIVRSLGGEDNAFTSQDYTAYYQSIASEHLELMMKIEAARMRGLDISEESFNAENKVILEERAQRTDNDPRAQLSEHLNEVLYANHPYAIPIIGWAHEIAALTWEDARAFYDRHYVPNNALLVISGDVTGDKVLEMAKRTYGLIPRGKDIERVRTVSPPFISQAQINLTHQGVQQAIWQRKYRVPSYRQNKEESLALQILENILSGGASARLYKSLVVEQKLASSIDLSYSAAAWDEGSVSVYTAPAQGITLDAVAAGIDDQLRLLIKDGVSDDELREAKNRLQAEAIYARDSLSGPAMIIGYNMITGSSLDDIETWPAQIEVVSAQQIQAVAAKYLNPDEPYRYPPVTGFLLPKEEN